MRLLAEAGNKVEMSFGNFSTATLPAVMVTYAQHPSLLGMANDCFYIWCPWEIWPAGREVPPHGLIVPLETEHGCCIHWPGEQGISVTLSCISPGWSRGRLTTLLHTTLCQEWSCQALSLKSNKLGVLWNWGIWLVKGHVPGPWLYLYQRILLKLLIICQAAWWDAE